MAIFVEFKDALDIGSNRFKLQDKFEIVPCITWETNEYIEPLNKKLHLDNIKWIEDNLDGEWSWFRWNGGYSYCFVNEKDKVAFLMCKG